MSVADRRETIGASAFWLDTWPRRYGCALIAVAAAALLRYYLDVALGFTQPFILFYPTIMLIALLGELGPGLFATLFSAVLAPYLFLEPLNSFAIRNSRDIVGLVLFAVMGVAISGMGALFRRRGRRLQEFEGAIENLEEMITVVPITVFNQDRDLRYTWIYNPQTYWQQGAIGKTDAEIIGTKKATILTDLKRRVLKTEVALRQEVVIPHITVEPLFDGAGKVIGITGASMDIAQLRGMTDRLQDARDKLAQEKSYLEGEIQTELGFEEIIGQSPALLEVLKNVRVVAPTDSTVLLLGETGTGKELVARSVHSLSSRRDKTFIKLNCAAVPAGLLESERFGHEKGAFTGAVNQKVGRIELADKGTLFLDEIGELPLELQPKLLRVLQDREFERLGGGIHTLHVDVRIISATNRHLHQDIANKKFREDLFYRLNVFPIDLPSLRQRRTDIPIRVHHFMSKHSAQMGKHIDTVPDETMTVLQNWNWPGNIRELENMI
jgi:transcriptional regulator with PAS, ATPase and Fis domain